MKIVLGCDWNVFTKGGAHVGRWVADYTSGRTRFYGRCSVTGKESGWMKKREVRVWFSEQCSARQPMGESE